MVQPESPLGEQAYNDSSMEVAQKIESVINMFPQPTEEQMEQFKELQESHPDLNAPSDITPMGGNPNTITNIQLYNDHAGIN